MLEVRVLGPQVSSFRVEIVLGRNMRVLWLVFELYEGYLGVSLGCRLGYYCPHPVTVYIRGPIKAMYNHINYK